MMYQEYIRLFDYLCETAITYPNLLEKGESTTDLGDEGKVQRIKGLNSILIYKSNGNPIPTGIALAENLEVLSIIAKSSKELVLEIGALSRLKALHLQGFILREIPDWVYTLVELEELFIEGSSIKSIPKAIKNLNNLNFIEIKQDKGLDSIDPIFFELESIQKCSLQIKEEAFVNIVNGKTLDNQLKGYKLDKKRQVISKYGGVHTLNAGTSFIGYHLSRGNRDIAKNTQIFSVVLKLPIIKEDRYLGDNSSFQQIDLGEGVILDEAFEDKDIPFLRLYKKTIVNGIRIPKYAIAFSDDLFVEFIATLEKRDLSTLKKIYDKYLDSGSQVNENFMALIQEDYIGLIVELYSLNIGESNSFFYLLESIKRDLHKDDLWKNIFEDYDLNKLYGEGNYWEVLQERLYEEIWSEKGKLITEILRPHEIEVMEMGEYVRDNEIKYNGNYRALSRVLASDPEYIIEKVVSEVSFCLSENLLLDKSIRKNPKIAQIYEVNLNKLRVLDKWGGEMVFHRRIYEDYNVNNSYNSTEYYSHEDIYLDGGGGSEWSDPTKFWD